MNDFFMNYGLAETILICYLEGLENIESDLYLNLIHADNFILEKLPETYIYCGTLDPLIDQCYQFYYKLVQRHIKSQLFTF